MNLTMEIEISKILGGRNPSFLPQVVDITSGNELVNRVFYEIDEPYDKIIVNFTLKGSESV